MCTVTFIPTNEALYLTSNRDEKKWRSPALIPDVYQFTNGKLVFPRDADAGGSWITSHENGNAIVLLNGAFKAHQSKPPYRKSRGLILLDIADAPSPYEVFRSLELSNIEPFTVIIWDDGNLYECRWDGALKHEIILDERSAHIWSSATLYDDEIIAKRQRWFDSWRNKQKTFSKEQILNFHQFTGDGDSFNDLCMNRDGEVFTVSVTCMDIRPEYIDMTYLDLKSSQAHSTKLRLQKTLVGR